MKRLAAALAALMMLCLCACGPAKPAPDSQDETPAAPGGGTRPASGAHGRGTGSPGN